MSNKADVNQDFDISSVCAWCMVCDLASLSILCGGSFFVGQDYISISLSQMARVFVFAAVCVLAVVSGVTFESESLSV